MPMVNIAGKEVEVDEEGYLVDLSQWNEDIAKYMAVE
ncbi:MAG: TusE/DsrC/DsvC family sulfur relay protein, partial [Thiobacillus sp.]